MMATDVPTDMQNSDSTSALPDAESSITMPTTAALSKKTTGE